MRDRTAMRVAAAISACFALAAPAAAEVTFQGGGAATYDDNLFRQSRALAQGQRRDDVIYDVGGVLTADAMTGSLEGRLTAHAAYDRFQHNGRLNNFNYSVMASVTRDAGSGIGVNVTGTSSRQLSSFADVRQQIRNLQSLNRADAEITLPITPDIRAVIDPNVVQSENSADLLKLNDYRQYGLRAGLGYYSPLGNIIALTATRRYTDGLSSRFVTQIDGSSVRSDIDLTDTSADLRLRYAVSPLTSIEGTVSYVERRDHSVLRGNYNGPSGNVTIDYHPRDTFSVRVNGGRRLEAQSFLFVDAVRTDFVTVTATFKLLDRFDAMLLGDHYRRRLRYDPSISTGTVTIVDRNYRFEGQLGYTVGARVRLGLRAGHEFRNSNLATSDFSATYVQASAMIAIGRTPTSTIGR